jgi:hypothetical protein
MGATSPSKAPYAFSRASGSSSSLSMRLKSRSWATFFGLVEKILLVRQIDDGNPIGNSEVV